NEDTNAQLLVEKSQITCKVTNCVFNDGLGRGFEVQEFSVSEIDLLMQNCSAINNVINGFEVNMSNGTLNAVLNDCEAKSNQATGYVISSPIPISGQINCCIGTENSIANFNISDTTNTILIVDDTKLTTSL
ncbi:MAG: hypothetical protein KAR79_05430, partial [Simkaniaceae bacterium]|nr:hypothetical protein [Simkaniaceae bacterium]